MIIRFDSFLKEKAFQPLADRINDTTGINNFSIARGCYYLSALLSLLWLVMGEDRLGIFLGLLVNMIITLLSHLMEKRVLNDMERGVFNPILDLSIMRITKLALFFMEIMSLLFVAPADHYNLNNTVELVGLYFMGCIPRPTKKNPLWEKLKVVFEPPLLIRPVEQ